jgi:hypothetical protein
MKRSLRWDAQSRNGSDRWDAVLHPACGLARELAFSISPSFGAGSRGANAPMNSRVGRLRRDGSAYAHLSVTHDNVQARTSARARARSAFRARTLGCRRSPSPALPASGPQPARPSRQALVELDPHQTGGRPGTGRSSCAEDAAKATTARRFSSVSASGGTWKTEIAAARENSRDFSGGAGNRAWLTRPKAEAKAGVPANPNRPAKLGGVEAPGIEPGSAV